MPVVLMFSKTQITCLETRGFSNFDRKANIIPIAITYDCFEISSQHKIWPVDMLVYDLSYILS